MNNYEREILRNMQFEAYKNALQKRINERFMLQNLMKKSNKPGVRVQLRANNNRFTHVAHLENRRLNIPITFKLTTTFPNHTPIKNYIVQKWNEHRGMVPVRDPLYGIPLNLKRISLNKLTNSNLRSARTEKRQNTKNTNEFHRNQAKKMVQVIIHKNGQKTWINSNGRKINAPMNSNVVYYGHQGGVNLYKYILKNMNHIINVYHRKHPNMLPHYHYREMYVKK